MPSFRKGSARTLFRPCSCISTLVALLELALPVPSPLYVRAPVFTPFSVPSMYVCVCVFVWMYRVCISVNLCVNRFVDEPVCKIGL
jgi:hypothetical protein